jgi:putative peptidoglycan lipid II flippase
MFPLKISGLALATSISSISTGLILLFILKNRLKGFSLKPIINSFVRILCASLCMGLVCYFVSSSNIVLGIAILDRALNLIIPIFGGLISYVIFCFVFDISEMRELWLGIMNAKFKAQSAK